MLQVGPMTKTKPIERSDFEDAFKMYGRLCASVYVCSVGAQALACVFKYIRIIYDRINVHLNDLTSLSIVSTGSQILKRNYFAILYFMPVAAANIPSFLIMSPKEALVLTTASTSMVNDC